MQRLLTGIGIAVVTIGVVAPAYGGAYCEVIAAPEIDPSVAQSALTVLVGGVLVLLGRRSIAHVDHSRS